LITEAEQALVASPHAVADFNVPGYYGQPAASMAAKQGLSDDASAAYALALAYQLDTGDRRTLYATKAVELLNAWAATNRRVSGEDGDLVLCYAGIPLVFAADLLSNYPGWRPEDRDAFKGWVNRVFRRSADKIKGRANNHGAWGTFASMAGAHLTDDADAVNADVVRLKQRIARAIASDGELPDENRRTNSGMWYTYFALMPMTAAAQIVLNATGEDLFRYTAPNGRSLKLALDRFFRHCRNPTAWPYKKPGGLFGLVYNTIYPSADELLLPTPSDWPGNLYEAMAAIYGERAWEEWVEKYRPIRGGRGWIYPTLMRTTAP
jgi:hypothetical protein